MREGKEGTGNMSVQYKRSGEDCVVMQYVTSLTEMSESRFINDSPTST